MFGDNVNSSSDSRYWGTVPQRLMLGRAIVIYWPSWPLEMRVGLIE
jgi:signal peptidase I